MYVFKCDLCVHAGVCSCNQADTVRVEMLTKRFAQTVWVHFNHKISDHAYHTCMHANTHTHTHRTHCGVLSLCGPVLGCGVKQEMCEPWRHVFMLAAVAHHQPEGKQTPAPLRLLSISLLLLQTLSVIFSHLWFSKISSLTPVSSFIAVFFPSFCFSSLLDT